MKKKALITGITGQDGSYLAEFLLEKGYVVHGIKRRASSFNTERIDHIYQDPHINHPDLILHYGDLTDGTRLEKLVDMIQPDEVAQTVWWLCQPGSASINGQAIALDGGELAG